MAQVFIVRANGGEWEDSFSFSVKAFMDESVANSFKNVCIEQHIAKVKLCDKINRWFKKWLVANPYPTCVTSDIPNTVPRGALGWDYDQTSPEWAAWQELYESERLAFENKCAEHRALWYKSYLLYVKSFNIPVAPIDDEEMVTGTIRYGRRNLTFHVEAVELG